MQFPLYRRNEEQDWLSHLCSPAQVTAYRTVVRKGKSSSFSASMSVNVKTVVESGECADYRIKIGYRMGRGGGWVIKNTATGTVQYDNISASVGMTPSTLSYQHAHIFVLFFPIALLSTSTPTEHFGRRR
jgi:hypothetical protein